MYNYSLIVYHMNCCEHSCLDTVGGACPPLPAVSARAVSSARLVWCVSSCRSAFAFLFFSVASPLLSARCARAGRSAPCARCSGTVPAAPRAAPPAAPPAAPRTGPVCTTATAFHMVAARSTSSSRAFSTSRSAWALVASRSRAAASRPVPSSSSVHSPPLTFFAYL